MKAWIYSFYLAIFFLVYGGVSLLSDTPFFVGTDNRKLGSIESFYLKLGPELSGTIFISLGLLFLFFSWKEHKSGEESHLTTMLAVKITFAFILLVALFIQCIF